MIPKGVLQPFPGDILQSRVCVRSSIFGAADLGENKMRIGNVDEEREGEKRE